MTLTLMEVGPTIGSAPVLKYVPEDFVVRESLFVDLVDEEPVAQRQDLILRKKGFHHHGGDPPGGRTLRSSYGFGHLWGT
jgi:hypothetical protein